MSQKIFKTFVLFSMIFLFTSSIIETTAYAVDQNTNTGSTISTETNTDTSKSSKDTVSSNDSSNKNSSNLSSTTNANTNTTSTNTNTDDKSKNKTDTKTVTEEKKEEIIDYGWKTINNKIYYIVNNKTLEKTGWFMEKDVNPKITRKDKTYDAKYYLDKDFSLLIGWKQIEKVWYYFNSQGILQTGWVEDQNLYYLDKNGEMSIGWNKINGNTYHFNQYGQATVGKKLVDNKWYFFDEKGALQKGFYEHNGKTYYSDESGIMITNQWINKRSHKYYVKADSSIAIGDIFINGTMEKFDEDGFYDGSNSSAKNDLYVRFLNVGNADCEFIKLPSGETVLIDTGDTTTTKTLIDFLNNQKLKTEFFVAQNNGQASVNNKTSDNSKIDDSKTSDKIETVDSTNTNTNNNVKDFNSLVAASTNSTNSTLSANKSTSTRLNNGKCVIDYVILTHPHSDHIGGLIELMKNFNIGKVIIPKYFEMKDYSQGADTIDQEKIDIIKYDYKVYKDTKDALLKSGLPIVQAEPNSFIDSEHILQFLHLDKDYSKLEPSNTYYTEYGAFNDNCAIVYLNYYDFQCLFSADIQWKAENDFVSRKSLNGKAVDILKIPHHGNVGSSSYTFIGYANPAIGIMSRAKERINTTNEPYDVLTTCGVNIYETSITDGVSVYATKDNWNLETK